MLNLSHNEARFFRDTGYFRLLNVLNSNETNELHSFVIEEKEKEGLVKLYKLYDRNSKLLSKLVKHPNLISSLKSVLGPNIIFVKNRHNHASVNTSNDTRTESRLHRDILQPTRGVITAVVYLEDANVENGCTHIVPGSQYLPYVGVPQKDGGGTWMDEHKEYKGVLDQAVPIPMPKGSVLLFDSLAFHTVGRNRSNKTRVSITLGFRSVDELDKKPDLERQILVSGDLIYRGNDRD
jgi:phytanoyl-CoA hydroxylase